MCNFRLVMLLYYYFFFNGQCKRGSQGLNSGWFTFVVLTLRPAEGVCAFPLCHCPAAMQGTLPMQSQRVWLKDFEFKAEEWLEITFLWQPRFSFPPASLVRHSTQIIPSPEGRQALQALSCHQ